MWSMAKVVIVANEHWAPGGFDHRAATAEIIKTATALMRGEPVAAVGHRVVHGGMGTARRLGSTGP